MGVKTKVVSRASLVLFFMGSNLGIHTPFVKIVRLLMRLIYVLNAIYSLVSLVPRFVGNEWSLGLIAATSWTISLIFSNSLLMFKQRSLETFLIELVDEIEASECRELSRNFTIRSICAFVFTIIVTAKRAYPHFMTSQPDLLLVGFLNPISQMASAYWILITVTFYWSAFDILIKYQERKLKLLIRRLNREPIDFIAVHETLQSISSAASRFEEILSFLPVIWFGNNFISGAGILSLNFAHSDADGYVILFHDYFPPLLLILLTCRGINSISALVQEAVRAACLQNVSSGKILLTITELRGMSDMQLTGMSFFSMDKSFFLSFIGSVLTFAALFQSYMH